LKQWEEVKKAKFQARTATLRRNQLQKQKQIAAQVAESIKETKKEANLPNSPPTVKLPTSPFQDMMFPTHQVLTHREELVKEILESERTYVQSLDLLVNMYLKPMYRLPENVVSKRHVRDIFSVVEVIHNYNSIFLSKLEERINTQGLKDDIRLGDVFLGLGDFMKMYTSFVSNYNYAVLTIADLKEKSPAFNNFLNETRRRCNLMDLQSLMIQPVQRVPRYELLLMQLIKYTPETHPDSSELHSVCFDERRSRVH